MTSLDSKKCCLVSNDSLIVRVANAFSVQNLNKLRHSFLRREDAKSINRSLCDLFVLHARYNVLNKRCFLRIRKFRSICLMDNWIEWWVLSLAQTLILVNRFYVNIAFLMFYRDSLLWMQLFKKDLQVVWSKSVLLRDSTLMVSFLITFAK